MNEFLSERDRKIIANLGKPSFTRFFTWRNAIGSMIVLLLATGWIWMLMGIGNSDWSRLANRVEKAATYAQNMVSKFAEQAKDGIQNLVQSLKEESVSAKATYDAPLAEWKIMEDSRTQSSGTWEMPKETIEVMANPDLHLPGTEELTEESDLPAYTQKEYELLPTWVVNTQEVMEYVDILDLNWTHTETGDDGQPVMVRFAEWRIHIKNTDCRFELLRSYLYGHSLLKWTDEDGLIHTQLVPFGTFIKIGWGTGATYLYQTDDGMIHFTQPANGYALFQVAFYAIPGHYEHVIMDSELPVPYGLISYEGPDAPWKLSRLWTNNLLCPNEEINPGSCIELK